MKQLITILKFFFGITIFNPFFLAGLFDFIKYGNYGFISFACLISLLCTSMILLLSGRKFFNN
jgi:hypothetical protein